MKRQLKEILEQLLAHTKKQNLLLEQIIRNQALLGHQNQRLHKTILSWWETDLDHHNKENDLIEKVLEQNPVRM